MGKNFLQSLMIKGRLRYKLFFIYTVPMLILFCLFVFISLSNAAARDRINQINYRVGLNRQILSILNTEIDQLNSQSLILYADTDSLSCLFEGPSNRLYYSSLVKIRSLLMMQMQTSDNLDGVALLTLDGMPRYSWSRTGYSLNLHDSSGDEWFDEVLTLGGQPLIRTAHMNLFFISAPNPVVSVNRVIVSATGKPLGVSVTFLEMKTFTNILETSALLEGERLFLIDEAAEIIWYSGGFELDDAPDFNDICEVYETTGGEPYGRYLISPSIDFGWRLVSILPEEAAPSLDRALDGVNLVLLFFSVALSFALSTLMAFLVTKPLGQFAKSFREVSLGNFDSPVSISGSDELSIIGHSYNEMLDKTKELIKDQYEMKLLSAQAELEALQSQINPHFLFNTLNSIKSTADGEDAEKTSQMVQVLADLLRYNLSRGQYNVSFEVDLNVARKYLFICQQRFGDRFEIEYDIDETVLPMTILKLTLQPLVENAVRHGLEPSPTHGLLRITAKSADSRYSIHVSNSGRIMNREKMVQLNERLSSILTEGNLSWEQSGVFNVNRRLRLSFGDNCGLSYSISGGMTTVSLSLPAVRFESPDGPDGKGG